MKRVRAPHMRVLHLLLILGGGRAAKAPPQPTLSNADKLVAGGTARAASQLIMYPADALRTLAQTRAGSKTLSELGAKTLVSGCFTTSGFAYFIGALQFGVFGATAAALGPVGASMCGAVASCAVSVPQEVIKQRLVTGIYPNFGSAVSTIWATQGLRGFYAGWLPTVSRNVPFVVATFTTFAALERRRKQALGSDALGFADSLQIGVLSAMLAGLITQPLDVVKTRMMTQAASSLAPYKSVGDCIATMWAAEGPLAFYAGLPQRSVYMGPLWAIQFALNGFITNAMLRRREQREE